MGGFFSNPVESIFSPPDPINKAVSNVTSAVDDKLVKAKLLPEGVADANRSIMSVPSDGAVQSIKKQQLLGS